MTLSWKSMKPSCGVSVKSRTVQKTGTFARLSAEMKTSAFHATCTANGGARALAPVAHSRAAYSLAKGRAEVGEGGDLMLSSYSASE